MHLTDLERHHLEAAAEGCTEKCISSRRRVSRNATARTLTRARRKLGANSTTQAVANYERLKASEELAEFVDDVQAIHERSGSLLERMRERLPARRPGVATCGVLLLLAFVPGMVGHSEYSERTVQHSATTVSTVTHSERTVTPRYAGSSTRGKNTVHDCECTSCGALKRTRPENLIYWESVADAEAEGRTKCELCFPGG